MGFFVTFDKGGELQHLGRYRYVLLNYLNCLKVKHKVTTMSNRISTVFITAQEIHFKTKMLIF